MLASPEDKNQRESRPRLCSKQRRDQEDDSEDSDADLAGKREQQQNWPYDIELLFDPEQPEVKERFLRSRQIEIAGLIEQHENWPKRPRPQIYSSPKSCGGSNSHPATRQTKSTTTNAENIRLIRRA
jgi:hypothetical protein